MRQNTKYTPKVFFRKNYQIRASEVRVLDDKGEMVGIMSIKEALQRAEELEIDLVEIAPMAKPPVAKLIDYSKFLYQLKKKKQEEKKGAKASETKQIRFGPFIGEHDLDIKLKRAKEFLTEGNKVKFTVRFTGRQMGRQDIGREKLEAVIEKLGEMAKVEREIKMEGRQMTMMITRNK
ncbi:MAG: translation initiation factor IF-3 [Candidatus Levybacteria bacterium]|nr:translation initiation factor IF-3 [Candidatus Levybacteria bacterium]